MSADPFDVRPDAETLAEAEEFVRTYAAVNATEASVYAEIVMARYDRLRAVADAARVFHAKGPDYWDDGKGDPEWLALGAALDALDGGGEQR